MHRQRRRQEIVTFLSENIQNEKKYRQLLKNWFYPNYLAKIILK